jgi:hypothetical protein
MVVRHRVGLIYNDNMEGLPISKTHDIEDEVLDPSKSSFVEQNLSLQKGPANTYIDTKTGEEFFLIDRNKHPEFQRFVSYLVKGIINTADIVEHNGQYFSHKQKLENVEKGTESYLENIKANVFILKNIFGDYDHNTETGQNIAQDDTNKNAYLYDFDQAGYVGLGAGEGFHSLQIQTQEAAAKYRTYILNEIYSPQNPWQQCNVDTLTLLKDKIHTLIGTIFSEEKYDSFKKIVEKAGTHFDEKTFNFYTFTATTSEEKEKEIFADLSARCATMKTAIEDVLNAQ